MYAPQMGIPSRRFVLIGTWSHLSSEELRNSNLDKYPQTRKAWRAAAKRFDASDDATKNRLRFERQWLYQMLLEFMNLLYTDPSDDDNAKGMPDKSFKRWS